MRYFRFSRTIPALPLVVMLACFEGDQPTEARKDTATVAAAVADAATGGQWSRVTNWPGYIAIHASLLPNGKVLFWPGEEGPHRGSKGFQYAFVWSPSSGAVQVDNRRTDVFCSGHAFLPNGHLLVSGGHIADHVGRREAVIFDYTRNRWSSVASMAKGRWYPTNTTLASGEVLTIAGNDENRLNNTIPEVWTGSGWRRLTSASLALAYYPRMFVAPNGLVFLAGEQRATRYLNPGGTGSWGAVVANSNYGTRDYGSAVMYSPGKVLIVGGGGSSGGVAPTNTAEIVDLNTTPVWRYTGSMAIGRRQLNATVLPDGKVLVTGGTSGSGFNNEGTPVLAAESWDPATGLWSQMASMTIPRQYHSVAVLLPDARVLAAGGGRCNGCTVDRPNAELFSPPYLFKGARPVLSSAPASVSYGQRFTVQTPDAAGIARVSWIGLSSVTHAFNMGQRFVALPFTVGSGNLTITAPTSRNHAPPGHYMLFILNGNGVPSVARIVRLG